MKSKHDIFWINDFVYLDSIYFEKHGWTFADSGLRYSLNDFLLVLYTELFSIWEDDAQQVFRVYLELLLINYNMGILVDKCCPKKVKN